MITNQGSSQPSGSLGLTVNRAIRPSTSPTIHQLLKRGLPNKHLPAKVNVWRRENLMRLLRGAWKIWTSEQLSIPFSYGALYLSIIRPAGNVSDFLKEYADLYPTLNGLDFTSWASAKGMAFNRLHLGLAGTRVVTTAGVGFIVDAFQNIVELEILKFHALGTGSTAEAVGDTALVTELTTEYNPDGTRATGTTTEGASPNIYRTLGTNTLDGTPGAALREHGVFSAATAGVLLDRTVFGAITLSLGDGLQSTYDHSQIAGS